MHNSQDINIITIQKSNRLDRSCFYLIEVDFYVTKKRFQYTGYLDPNSNKILNNKIEPSEYIIGNNRSKLLTELAVKLHITDDDACDLFDRIVQNINNVVEHTPSIRKQLPPVMDIIRIALKFGFQLHQLRPEFHFIQTIHTAKGDVELHICTPSVSEVIDELNYFSESITVSETYTYHQLMQMCMWHSDFFIFINQLANGWTICWHGEDVLDMQSRRVDTLRTLYFAILDCQSQSKYR